MAALQIESPYDYYADPTIGRPVFNGQIFIGLADKDPTLQENQITVLKTTESGKNIPIQQPVKTSSGGVPVDENRNYISIATDGVDVYSVKVLNKQGSQVYYEPFAKSSTVGFDKVTYFDTLDQAINNGKIFNGSALNIHEYSLGNGGGAMWDVVLTSSVVPNG